MTTAAHVPSDVEAYVARVRDALADVPAEERNDLLAEVEASLYESASESGGSVAARLGPPEEFAAELRSAAGLHAPSKARKPGLRASLERLAAEPRVRATGRIVGELAPVWWVARGYVLVAVLALIGGADWSISHHSVPRIGTAGVGLALIAAAVVASVALGLWGRRARLSLHPLVLLADVVLLAAAIPVAVHVAKGAPHPAAATSVIQTEIVQGLAYNGTPLTNVYPYSRDGRPLRDVLLYTASGAPIDIRSAPDPNRRVLYTVAGLPVLNAFPIRYYAPGSRFVRHPDAGPTVHVPKLKTPPLPVERR